MNSLVVLLSMMALTAAKPGLLESGIVSYAAPAVIVAPAAVSHQSRIDIKSSPAVVATQSVEPLTRAVIAEPAIVAAPGTYAAPIAYTAPAAYSAPATFVAPTAYTAPLAIGVPAAVSSQSRVDIKSSPTLINTFAAAPVFKTLAGVPIAYSAPLATYTPSIYSPAIAPVVPVVKTADIESAPSVDQAALPVAPTETPEVAAARAAHLEAKALEEHKIQKRSPGLIPAVSVSSYSAAPVISSYGGHFVYPATITRTGTPIAVSAPILTSAYGIHPY